MHHREAEIGGPYARRRMLAVEQLGAACTFEQKVRPQQERDIAGVGERLFEESLGPLKRRVSHNSFALRRRRGLEEIPIVQPSNPWSWKSGVVTSDPAFPRKVQIAPSPAHGSRRACGRYCRSR